MRILVLVLSMLLVPVCVTATDPIGALIGETDGSPDNTFFYKILFPAGAVSVVLDVATIDMTTWADTSYLRLDGTNDPVTGEVEFQDDIYSPVSGCTDATTLTITGVPAHCDAATCGSEIDADIDGIGACDGASTLLIFTEEMDSVFLAICTPGSATDLIDAYGELFTFGTDNLRLCIVDVNEEGGGGPYVSALIPSSDSCDTLVFNFGLPANQLVYDDADYFTYNATTCTYDWDPDTGITKVASWDDPTVTTDSAVSNYWKIQQDGNSNLAHTVFSDGFRVGDALPPGLYGAGSITKELTGADSNVAYFGLTTIISVKPTGTTSDNFGGIYAAVTYESEENITGQLTAANYETLIQSSAAITNVAVQKYKNYIDGSATITKYVTISSPGPNVQSGTPVVSDYRGTEVLDWDIDAGASLTLTNNIGTYYGARTVGTNNYAVYSLADYLLTDNTKVWFGTDKDIGLSSSTAGQLNLAPSVADTDIALYFNGTSNQGTVTYMEDEDRFDFAETILAGDKILFTQTDGNEYIDSLADGYMDYGATTAHRFGAAGDTTNYTEIKADGEINLHGTARVYKNEWVTLGAMKAPDTKPARYTDYGISGAYTFDDGDDETVIATIRLPQDMDKTVAPEVKLGWGATATTGAVVWQIEYLYRAPNEDLTAAADASPTTTTTVSGTSKGLTISTITLATPGSTDQLLLLRIKRLGANGSDALSGDANLVGCGLKYTSDKLGSAL